MLNEEKNGTGAEKLNGIKLKNEDIQEDSTNISFFYKVPRGQKEKIHKNLMDEISNIICSSGNNESTRRKYDILIKLKGSENYVEPTRYTSLNNKSELNFADDPNDENVSYIYGNGPSYLIGNGERERWAPFDMIYKELKYLENKGVFKKTGDGNFGGQLVIERNGEVRNFNIGVYKPRDILREMDLIFKEHDKKFNVVKKITLTKEAISNLLSGEYDVRIPVTGLMGKDPNDLSYDPEKDTRCEVGSMEFQDLVDPVDKKTHRVLELSISEDVTVHPETIVDFIQSVNAFAEDNNIEMEGVLPEENLRYDISSRECKLMVVEPMGGKYLRCETPQRLTNESINYYLMRGLKYTVKPSTLSYDNDGSFSTNGFDINGLTLKPVFNKEARTATMDILQGAMSQKVYIEPCKEADHAKFVFDATSPTNITLPDVNDFFADKKSTMFIIKTFPSWLPKKALIDKGYDKADFWHFTQPIDTQYKVEHFLFDLFDKSINGVNMPREIRCDNFLLNGKISSISFSHDQLMTMFDSYAKLMNEQMEKEMKDEKNGIEFPDF